MPKFTRDIVVPNFIAIGKIDCMIQILQIQIFDGGEGNITSIKFKMIINDIKLFWCKICNTLFADNLYHLKQMFAHIQKQKHCNGFNFKNL